MARRSGLGKGLGALIPTGEVVDSESTALQEIPVSQVRPNQHQPRAYFDEEALVSLSASIRELGVLQPILVRPFGRGQFELIAGERRWRAAKRVGTPDGAGSRPRRSRMLERSSRRWSRTCIART